MSKTKQILFSGNFISKDDKRLDISEFKEMFSLSEESEILGNVVHTYSIDFDSTYMKISFSDGSTFPDRKSVV